MLYVNPMTSLSANADPGRFQAAKEKQSLQEMERLFLYTMMQEMRKTTGIAKSDDNSQAKAYFNEMLDDALSGEMAKSGQLGVGKEIAAQLRQASAQPQIRGLLHPQMREGDGNGSGSMRAGYSLDVARALTVPVYGRTGSTAAASKGTTAYVPEWDSPEGDLRLSELRRQLLSPSPARASL